MPMKVRYTVVNGQVISENRNGVRRDYILDALGNTVALMDSTGALTDTFKYFPSGTVSARTGTTPTPFQYVGGAGYYRDTSKRTYVRARNLSVNMRRWAETDPIGFEGGDYNLYRYVANNFVNVNDPSGLYKDAGRATCFNDSGVFCNPGLKGCPTYKHGMTASWPHVCYRCGKDGCYTGHQDHSVGSYPAVKCGDTIKVTAFDKPNCSFELTIIDVGPKFEDSGNMVYLSPAAAKAMCKCLRKKKCKCGSFSHYVWVDFKEATDCSTIPLD
jgi:RHS repeat-associated protein